MNYLKSILSFLLMSASIASFAQFSDIQSAIEGLADGETFIIDYNKSGDWGAYEGGQMEFTLKSDTIHLSLTNKQNYLGAEKTTTTSAYNKYELLETLQDNKKSYTADPDNVVFNNTFNYTITQNGKELSHGKSPMEPTDVVNKLSLNHRIKNIFFKEDKKVFNHGINGVKKQ